MVAAAVVAVGLLVAAPTGAGAAGGDGAAGDGTAPATTGDERVVVVGENDTLWTLAPAGVDRQAWAAEVAEHNGVAAGAVRPGQPLRIPESAE